MTKQYGTRFLVLIFVVHCMTHGLRSAHAEESEAIPLEPIVVSASAYPVGLEQTPASVTIITPGEIEQQHAESLTDLLHQVPGLFVDQMGARGGLSSAYIRGGDPNFTPVLIDGVQVNDPTNPRGGSVDLSSLDPVNIERIEILRGPFSTLYGSDAMGGAINVITRGAVPDYQIQVEGGHFGYARGLIQAGSRGGSFDYSLSASSSRTGEEVEEGPFRLGSVVGNLNMTLPQSKRLKLTLRLTETDVHSFPDGSGGPRLAILNETEHRETHEQIFGLDFDHTVYPIWEYDLIGTLYDRGQGVDSPGVQSKPGVFAIPPTTFKTDYRRVKVAWRNFLKVQRAFRLAVGVEQTEEEGERSGIQHRGTSTVFAEATAFLPQALTLIGGLRLDFPEEFKRKVSPRIGINYRPWTETTLHASYGQGFKLPSFTALGDPLIGNSDLEPETSHGWDVGIRQDFWDRRMKTEINYFSNVFHRLIDLDPERVEQGVFQLVNLNEVRTWGIELEASVRGLAGTTVRVNGTYLVTDILGSEEELRNRPRLSGGVGVIWNPYPILRIYGELIATSKRFDLQIPTLDETVAGFSRVNFTITVLPAKHWELFIRTENLLNKRHEEYIGFPAPGLNAKGGLAYTF